MNKRTNKYYKYIFLTIGIIFVLSFTLFKKIPKKIIPYKSVKPLHGITIVVDPGHGGVDGGTMHGDLLEKDINLAIGLRLREGLLNKGANVVMTREIDKSLEELVSGGSRHSRDLKARVKIIQESKAHIFISVHVNHIKNPKPLGAIVFYNLENKESEILGEYLQKELNQLSTYKESGIEINRLPLGGDYYILNNNKIPGVLIETGFISNELDRKLLLEDNHQEEVVNLIIKGIFNYFDLANDDI